MYNKKENRWVFKKGTFRNDYYWEKIKKSTPYYEYISVAIEKLLNYETIESDCECELEFSIVKSIVEVSQADYDTNVIHQEVTYNNEDFPYIRLVTLYKKRKGEYFFNKISLDETKLRRIF